MATGSSCLSMKDFNDVYLPCKPISAQWETLATYLKVDRPTVNAIKVDGKDVNECLMKLLDTWLKKTTRPRPSWKVLCDALFHLDTRLSEELSQKHPSCQCHLCTNTDSPQVSGTGCRSTPVAVAVNQSDAKTAADQLKNDFEDLLAFMVQEIKRVDVYMLRYEICKFFRDEEGETDPKISGHLEKIEDYPHSNAVFDHFIRCHFIGYINYSLIKVFQKVANSRLLNKRIEEYEKDYKCFLELSLKNVHDVFQKWPDHRPKYPAGIPKFKLHLQSEWEGKSMLELREFLQECHSDHCDIDQFMITKIEESCIIITFAVLPHIAKRVVECLTSDGVAGILKSNGVSVEISPELHKCQAKLPSPEPSVQEVAKYKQIVNALKIELDLKSKMQTKLLMELDKARGVSKSETTPALVTYIDRGTQVAFPIDQRDAKNDAYQLREDFTDLLKFMAKEIEQVDVFWLSLEIENFFKNEKGETSAAKGDQILFQDHVIKLKGYDSPNAILNHLVRHDFLGYINYSLIKVFQKVTKSQLLDKRIEEYEKNYKIFLVRNFRDIENIYQQCPDIFREYPAGIPKFKIHLKSEWQGKGVFILGDYIELCRLNIPRDIDQLTVEKIIIEC